MSKSSGQSRKKEEVEFISVRSPRSSRVGQPVQEPSKWLVFGIFALVTLVFFGAHLLGTAFLWEDFTEQYLPFQTFAAASLADGTFPFWNPYTFGGMPFFADLQNGVLYPGHLLMYLFSGGELSVWLAQALVIVHYFVAMIGAWFFAGVVGVRSWGRVFAGIGFGLSGIMVAQMIHPNMIFHMAFFPLIAGLYWSGLRDRKPLHTLLSGLLFGLVMLSGHPQTALYILFFLILVTIFETIREIRSEEKDVISLAKALGISLASMILAAGLFAIQYLPSTELADLSQRSEMTYEASLDGSLEMRQLITLVAPEYFGVVAADPPDELPFWLRGGGDRYYFWETVIYVGITTLILGIIGLAGTRRKGTRWFLLGAGLLGVAYGLGDHFVLHPILGSIPPFDTFRIPARMGLYFALGLPVLAGFGLDMIVRGEIDSRSGTKLLMVTGGFLLFIAILLAGGALSGALDVPPTIADAITTTAVPPILFTLITVLLIFLALRGKLPALGTSVAMLLLLVVDLFTFGIGLNQSPTNPEDQLNLVDQNLQAFRANPPEEIFRVQMRGIGSYGGAMLTLRNQGPYSRFMLIEGYNPLVLQRAYPKGPDFETVLDLMNVKYAIEVDSTTGAPLGYRTRETQYPHARLVYDVKSVDSASVEDLLTSGGIDLLTTAVVGTSEQPDINGSGTGSAQISAYTPNMVTVRTTSSEEALLVVSEVFYPAWKAYIDNAEVPITRVNWAQRGVYVPPGDHTVEMKYESSPFSTGRIISIISFLLLVGGILYLFMQNKKHTIEEAEPREDS